MNTIQKNFIQRAKSLQPTQVMVLICIAAMTILAVKFYGRQPVERIVMIQVVGKPWTQNYYNYSGYRAPFWLSENIHVGDTETTINGWRSGEIVDIEQYDRGGTDFDLYVAAKLKGEINKKTNKFIYNSNPVEVGSAIELHLTRTAVFGQIIDDNVPQGGYKEKELLVTLYAKNIDPWVIDALQVGDSMTDGPNKKRVATLDKVDIEPATSAVFLSDANLGPPANNTFLEINPKVKNLVLHTRLRVQYHAGGWYFGGHQLVKVGQQLWLYFSKTNIVAEIQSIQDVPSQ